MVKVSRRQRRHRQSCCGALPRIGEDHPGAVLSNHEVDLIRTLRRDGMTYREIAIKFEVSCGHAHDICHKRRRRF